MSLGGSAPTVGALVREWRRRRRLSQLDLALDAGVSARHLSFVETGRSRPGREMLLRVLDVLEVPAREQNQLLLAAGHAPAFPERSLQHPDLAPVRHALEQILERHEPYPAIAVDRHWNLLAANASVRSLTSAVEIDPELLKPPVNVLRVGLHPRGLAPLLVNPYEWQRHFLERLRRQTVTTSDARLVALTEELRAYAYPGRPGAGADREHEILGPLKFRAPDDSVLSFFGMFATFDTPFEVNASELAIELLFPSDQATADRLLQPQ